MAKKRVIGKNSSKYAKLLLKKAQNPVLFKEGVATPITQEELEKEANGWASLKCSTDGKCKSNIIEDYLAITFDVPIKELEEIPDYYSEFDKHRKMIEQNPDIDDKDEIIEDMFELFDAKTEELRIEAQSMGFVGLREKRGFNTLYNREYAKPKVKDTPQFKELEKNRKKLIKQRGWLWNNYNDELMVTEYRWIGKWRKPKE